MRLIESMFWGKVFLRFFVIAFFGIVAIVLIMSSFSKPVPLASVFKADNMCGQLPELQFNGLEINYSNADIKLNVQEQLYQDIPPIAYVYKVNLIGETFTTKEKAFRIAEIFDFEPNTYKKPEATVYEWSDYKRFLRFNTNTSNFYYTLKDVAMPPIPNPDIPPVVEAKQLALNVLNKFESSSESQIYTFMVDFLSENEDIEVDSLETARAVRVDIQKHINVLKYPTVLLDEQYRKKHSNVKIDFLQYFSLADSENLTNYNTHTVAEAPFLGGTQIYIISRYNDDIKNVGRVRYSNWKLEDTPCGTYSIISAKEAFVSVQRHEAKIVYAYKWGQDRLNVVKTGTLKSLNIFNIYLAYYQPKKQLSYLQPIYVVEADGYLDSGERVSVFFYVPAVKKL